MEAVLATIPTEQLQSLTAAGRAILNAYVQAYCDALLAEGVKDITCRLLQMYRRQNDALVLPGFGDWIDARNADIEARQMVALMAMRK
jgi:hypothetical protein